MSKKEQSQDVQWTAPTNAEQAWYDTIFFAQEPIDGLLPDLRARELLLRSGLPLTVLSKVWHMVDVPKDNLLDRVEFSRALHLLRAHLSGVPLPPALPVCLQTAEKDSDPLTESNIAGEHSMTSPVETAHAPVALPGLDTRHVLAYIRLFEALRRDREGMLTATTARRVLLTSQLPVRALARVWDLADVDRDARLSAREFCLACHLVTCAKQGYSLDWPVNVHTLLPDQTPPRDLAAMSNRLKALERRKLQLMGLRERRREEAGREARRVELCKQRLQILTAMHRALREDKDDVTVTSLAHVTSQAVKRQEAKVTDLQTLATRLRRSDEQVRKQTTRVIIAEQQLARDVTKLQKEADQLKLRKSRSSVLQDLDPFHQLYEQRKEERLSKSPKSSTGSETESESAQSPLPPHLDPFRDLDSPRMPGAKLFHSESDDSGTMASDPWNTSVSSAHNSSAVIGQDFAAMTQGFEDSFLERWAEPGNDVTVDNDVTASTSGVSSKDPLDDLFSPVSGEDDVEFKTVSVTEEDDNLWSSLPSHELATHSSQLGELQQQLQHVNTQLAQLQPATVFRDPADYVRQRPKPTVTDRHLPRRASDSALQRPLTKTPEQEKNVSRPARRETTSDASLLVTVNEVEAKAKLDSGATQRQSGELQRPSPLLRQKTAPSLLEEIPEKEPNKLVPGETRTLVFEGFTQELKSEKIQGDFVDATSKRLSSTSELVSNTFVPGSKLRDTAFAIKETNFEANCNDSFVTTLNKQTVNKTNTASCIVLSSSETTKDPFKSGIDNIQNTDPFSAQFNNSKQQVDPFAFQSQSFEDPFRDSFDAQFSKDPFSSNSDHQKSSELHISSNQDPFSNGVPSPGYNKVTDWFDQKSVIDPFAPAHITSQSIVPSQSPQTENQQEFKSSTPQTLVTSSVTEHSPDNHNSVISTTPAGPEGSIPVLSGQDNSPVSLRESHATDRSTRDRRAQTWNPLPEADPVPPPRRRGGRKSLAPKSPEPGSNRVTPQRSVSVEDILDGSKRGGSGQKRTVDAQSPPPIPLRKNYPSKKRLAPKPPQTSPEVHTLFSPKSAEVNTSGVPAFTGHCGNIKSNSSVCSSQNTLSVSLNSPSNTNENIPFSQPGSDDTPPVPPPRNRRQKSVSETQQSPCENDAEHSIYSNVNIENQKHKSKEKTHSKVPDTQLTRSNNKSPTDVVHKNIIRNPTPSLQDQVFDTINEAGDNQEDNKSLSRSNQSDTSLTDKLLGEFATLSRAPKQSPIVEQNTLIEPHSSVVHNRCDSGDSGIDSCVAVTTAQSSPTSPRSSCQNTTANQIAQDILSESSTANQIAREILSESTTANQIARDILSECTTTNQNTRDICIDSTQLQESDLSSTNPISTVSKEVEFGFHSNVNSKDKSDELSELRPEGLDFKSHSGEFQCELEALFDQVAFSASTESVKQPLPNSTESREDDSVKQEEKQIKQDIADKELSSFINTDNSKARSELEPNKDDSNFSSKQSSRPSDLSLSFESDFVSPLNSKTGQVSVEDTLESDMEAQTRKLQLEKLRGNYFGAGGKSPVRSPRSSLSPKSPTSPITSPFNTDIRGMDEDVVVVIDKESTSENSWKKKYYNRTSLDISYDKNEKEVLERTPAEKGKTDKMNSREEQDFLSSPNGDHSGLDLNANMSATPNSKREVTAVELSNLSNDNVAKYMRDHVILKKELKVDVDSNYMSAHAQQTSQDGDDSDDSHSKFKATFDPWTNTQSEHEMSAAAQRNVDTNNVTLISYNQVVSSPTSPGGNKVPLRAGEKPAEEDGRRRSIELKITASASVVSAEEPIGPPPPVPVSPPPASTVNHLETDSNPASGVVFNRPLKSAADIGIYNTATAVDRKGTVLGDNKETSVKITEPSSASLIGSAPTTEHNPTGNTRTRAGESYAKYGKSSAKFLNTSKVAGNKTTSTTSQLEDGERESLNLQQNSPQYGQSADSWIASASVTNISKSSDREQQLDKHTTVNQSLVTSPRGVNQSPVSSPRAPRAVNHSPGSSTRAALDSAHYSGSSPRAALDPVHSPAGAMDPVTGLRRTGGSTPMDKALRFVEAAEPSFRVKRVEDEDKAALAHLTGFKTRAQEIEQERLEILDEMRMRKKTMTSWLNEDTPTATEVEVTGGGVGGAAEKSESERLYEERKKQLREREEAEREGGGGTEQQPPPLPSSRPPQPADIDATSLTDKKKSTIREWEDKFSAPDTQLYPSITPTIPTPSPSAQQRIQHAPTIPVVKATDYSVRPPDNESAIEREIRLAQEREEDLRQQRLLLRQQLADSETKLVQDRTQSETLHKASPTMPIHKLPVLSNPTRASMTTAEHPQQPQQAVPAQFRPPQLYSEMTEVDRDEMKRESIIEREIREQLAREQELRQRAALAATKEQEQSDFERQEKESEAVRAHESIIEREIREQQEREREFQALRIQSPTIPSYPAATQPQFSPQATHSQSSPAPRTQHSKMAAEPQSAPAIGSQYSSDSDESGSGRVGSYTVNEPVYDPQTGRVDATITYVDAISNCTHQGESLIARELREQREREEELRSQWKAAGRDVPPVTLEPADTPYNLPDPPRSQTQTSRATTNSYRRGSVESQSSNTTDTSQIDGREPVSAPAVAKTPVTPKVKVQPLVTDEDEEEAIQFRFVPVSETPIEREIRLNRNREEALRAERGLPAAAVEIHNEIVIDTKSSGRSSQRPMGGGGGRRASDTDHASMKRFATGRLHQEMVKDKQREVELKSSGIIATLSEERVGELMDYRSIIPSEPVAPPAPTSHYISRQTSRPSQQPAPAQPAQPTQQQTPAQSQQTAQRPAQQPAQKVVNGGQTSPRSPPVAQAQMGSSAPPPVVSNGSAHAHVKSSAASGESIIERELREQREREEELRRQRQMLASGNKPQTMLPPGRETVDATPTLARLVLHDNGVIMRNGSDVPPEVRAARRKSSLAQEWEKKIGATSS